VRTIPHDAALGHSARTRQVIGGLCCDIFAFSALTLLVGWQEGHLACKTEWCGTGVVICLEQGADDLHMLQLSHCHSITSCSSKIQNYLLFWCQLTKVVVEKRPLNGCSVVVVPVVCCGIWLPA